MSQETVQRVLEQLETLGPQELEQVQQALRNRLPSNDQTVRRAAAEEALRAAGLVKVFRTPPPGTPVNPPLAKVRGKPLSETIIEERR